VVIDTILPVLSLIACISDARRGDQYQRIGFCTTLQASRRMGAFSC
jgi:hypothetical protein